MLVKNEEIVLSLPDAYAEELMLHRNCRSYNTANSSGMCKALVTSAGPSTLLQTAFEMFK